MRRAFVIATAVCAFSQSAFAQETLIGQWSGGYFHKGVNMNVAMELEITSVEGDLVRGNLKEFSRTCGGDYAMVGKIEGKSLGLRAVKPGGPRGDCAFGFRATMDGSKMTGLVGGTHDLTLTKK
jgi:hypothetical protein